MIVTLTPNPSIDRTITVETLAVGRVNRGQAVRQDPGGKGVNVSRALTLHGIETVAVMPLGGSEGAMMRQLLDDAGVVSRTSLVHGSTRVNTAIVESGGVTTKVNEPGPRLDESEVSSLMRTACQMVEGPKTWVVGAGSLPAGVSDDFYARLIGRVHEVGGKVAIDSSGTPFLRAIEACPDLIKPNHHELGEVVGRELETIGDVTEAARHLVDSGIGCVVVSLGGSGALAITATQTLHGAAPAVRPRSTVGAGDAMLAGFVMSLEHGASVESSLSVALRFGTAAVQLDGSLMPDPEAIALIRPTITTTPDLDSPIEE